MTMTSHFKFKEDVMMTCERSDSHNHKFMVTLWKKEKFSDSVFLYDVVNEVTCQYCLMKVVINDSLYFGSACNEVRPAVNGVWGENLDE